MTGARFPVVVLVGGVAVAVLVWAFPRNIVEGLGSAARLPENPLKGKSIFDPAPEPQEVAPAQPLNPKFRNDKGEIRQLAYVTTPGHVWGKPRAEGKLIARVKSGQYIICRSLSGEYYGIQMADGKVGFLKANRVKLLDTAAETTLVEGATRGRRLVSRAFTYLGVPYVWGGASEVGLDCSGFIQRIFREEGIRLPRVADQQAAVGAPVSDFDLRPGDRVYFQSSETIDHTGMFIGEGQFIHSSSSGGGVVVDRLFTPSWQAIYAGARRSPELNAE